MLSCRDFLTILMISCLVGGCQPDVTDPGRRNSMFVLQFDGINDEVYLGDPDPFEFGMNDFTLEVLFRTSRRDTIQQLIRKGFNNRVTGEGRWVLSIDTTNVIRIVVEDVNNWNYTHTFISLGSTDVCDNDFHHVTAVFDRDSALTVYLDGYLESSDTSFKAINGPILNNVPVYSYIGRCDNAESRFYFRGLIANIRVWGAALRQEEIIYELDVDLTLAGPPLIAWYRMCGEEIGYSSQILKDFAGTNHGRLGSTIFKDDEDPKRVELHGSTKK